MKHLPDASPQPPNEWPKVMNQSFQLRRNGDGWAASVRDSRSERGFSGRSSGPRLFIDLPNWLGDLVMALPATDRLVRANARGTTTLHVRPAAARLVKAIFADHAQVISTPRRQMPVLTWWKLVRESRRWDIGITLRNATRAKIVLWLASRWRLGTSSQGGKILLNWSHTVAGDRHQVHDADRLLVRLGLPPVDPDWRAVLPEHLRRVGAANLERAGLLLTDSIVGLAPGVACGGSAKRWPEQRFGRLAASLRALGHSPVVVIGPGEGDLARTVVAASKQEIPVVGEDLDAAGLAGILSNLSALVGNDSGPAHTAAVLGVPTVALFGPTDPSRTAPSGAKSTVTSLGLECAPCVRSKCPLEHNECMKGLSVESVESGLVALFDQHRGKTASRAIHA